MSNPETDLETFPSQEILQANEKLANFLENSNSADINDYKQVLKNRSNSLEACNLVNDLFSAICSKYNLPESISNNFVQSINFIVKDLNTPKSPINLTDHVNQQYVQKLQDADIESNEKEQQISSLSSEMQKQESRYKEELIELRNKLSKKKTKLDKAKLDLELHEISLNSKEKHIQQLKQSLNLADIENMKLMKDQAEYKDKIKENEKQIITLEGKIQNLELQLHSSKRDENLFDEEIPKLIKMENLEKLFTEFNEKDRKNEEDLRKSIRNLYDLFAKIINLFETYEYQLSLYKETIDSNTEAITNHVNHIKKLEEQLHHQIEQNSIQENKISELQQIAASQPKSNTIKEQSQEPSVTLNAPQPTNASLEKTNEALKQQINQLTGSIDTLAQFIESILTHDYRVPIPLLEGTAPILNDEQLKNLIIDRISRLRGRFDNFRPTQETEFFKQVFRDSEQINQIISSFINSGRNDYYAVIIALCAANKRLLSFIDYQDSVLESLNEYVPSSYENTEDSLISFMSDSKTVYDQLKELSSSLIDKGKKSNKFDSIFSLLSGIKRLLNNLDVLHNFIDNDKDIFEIPLEAKDLIINFQNESELIKSQYDILKASEEQSQYENSLPNEVIVEDTAKIDQLNQNIARLEKKIKKLKGKNENLKSQSKYQDETIEALKLKIHDKELQIRSLEISLKRQTDLLEKEKKNSEKRIKIILEDSSRDIDNQIEQITKRYKSETEQLKYELDAKIDKINALKTIIKELNETFTKIDDKNKQTLKKLTNKIYNLKKSKSEIQTKYDAMVKKSNLISSQSSLTALTQSLTSLQSPKTVSTNDQDDPLSRSFTSFDQSTPDSSPNKINSLLAQVSPIISRGNLTSPMNSSEILNLTGSYSFASPMAENSDRFLQQLGKILGKYYKNDSVWTRAKISTCVSSLVDKVIFFEDKDDSSKFNVNEKYAMLLRQNEEWKKMGREACLAINVNYNSPKEAQLAILDFVHSTVSKCKLVSKLQVLRFEKKLLIKHDDLINLAVSHDYKLKSVITAILVSKKFAKFANSEKGGNKYNSPTRIHNRT